MYYAMINGREIEVRQRKRLADPEWNGRESYELETKLSHAEAAELFVENADWGLKYEPPEGGEGWERQMTEFCVAGPITDLRDGRMIVKMGRITDSEALAELLEVLDGQNEPE